MRMKAVTSNGSRYVVNKATPKSAMLPKTLALPAAPMVEVGWCGVGTSGPRAMP